ncbi:DeoR/GlpR family transcriptional regulator [Actinoplanes sp. LDG1-06]|uniref:DeoR/GlpR family transcriptional regulator n=1 Tax=Paractinoplanes ovalisporus TaxID=2810368 RepID=A0ABS2AIN3_9ACTN|nr:substrate-binding domain-containing protein [Actinoplanes ovalisporus]MBM2619709.1 DeoR/GlpR family transcriptional regulator [Actinoplanes ovalisporus]
MTTPVHVLNAQRRERLLAELHKHGAVRVAELATLFQVSPVTVRRDITVLAREKRLVRVHGGALVLPDTARRPQPADRLSLGMIVPSLDFFWPQVITGARTAAAMLGADLRLRGSGYDPGEDRRQMARLLEAEKVDGLLVAPDVRDDLTAISALPIPCVLVERAAPVWGPDSRPLESVRNDHDAGVEIALRHLSGQGHRRIGLVVTPISPNAELIEQGFVHGCRAMGLDGELIVRDTLRADPGRARDVLNSCRVTGTTALLVHSDPDAIALARQAASEGVEVPRELALVSYDDEVAHQGEPPLTAVRPAKGQIGRMAVEMLVSRLTEGDRRPANRLQLVPGLIVRQSSLTPHR